MKQLKAAEPATNSCCPQPTVLVFKPPLKPVVVHAHGSYSVTGADAGGAGAKGAVATGSIGGRGAAASEGLLPGVGRNGFGSAVWASTRAWAARGASSHPKLAKKRALERPGVICGDWTME
jgi:hypothetical protein